ncbi:MAG TPA: ATP-binding protein [Streptosporangiaceae bacterium]
MPRQPRVRHGRAAAFRMRLSVQVLVLQIGVVLLVVGVGFGLVWNLLDDQMTGQYGQRALAVARSVAADRALADDVARGDPGHRVQAVAERVRRATGALFVVVTDRHGIRLAHPNPWQIGRRVSTDPSGPLAGRDVVNVERGTLGLSARGKVPLRDASGAVVGEVSVGIGHETIAGHLTRQITVVGLFACGALLLGVFGSYLLTRRVKKLTLGLEPYELGELVREREAVLHGIGEGVLAVDEHGRVSVCNAEASRLLGVAPARGTPVGGLELPPRLRGVLDRPGDVDNVLAIAGDRVLVAGRRSVRRDGRDLGGVLTLRDRTDLENLTRELDAVRSLTDGLRAQRHEFSNRLHTLAGLLQTGHHTEAVEFVHALSDGPVPGALVDTEAIRDPHLQAFLSAKSAVARENGVLLEASPVCWVPTPVVAPVEVTTVVGNLVDNALEAARLGTRTPARVEVDLLSEGTTLHVSVADSGTGIPPRLVPTIFNEGVTTRPGDSHGFGLALSRQAAESVGGELHLANPGDATTGAVFTAKLPTVLAPDPTTAPPPPSPTPADPPTPGSPAREALPTPGSPARDSLATPGSPARDALPTPDPPVRDSLPDPDPSVRDDLPTLDSRGATEALPHPGPTSPGGHGSSLTTSTPQGEGSTEPPPPPQDTEASGDRDPLPRTPSRGPREKRGVHSTPYGAEEEAHPQGPSQSSEERTQPGGGKPRTRHGAREKRGVHATASTPHGEGVAEPPAPAQGAEASGERGPLSLSSDGEFAQPPAPRSERELTRTPAPYDASDTESAHPRAQSAGAYGDRGSPHGGEGAHPRGPAQSGAAAGDSRTPYGESVAESAHPRAQSAGAYGDQGSPHGGEGAHPRGLGQSSAAAGDSRTPYGESVAEGAHPRAQSTGAYGDQGSPHGAEGAHPRDQSGDERVEARGDGGAGGAHPAAPARSFGGRGGASREGFGPRGGGAGVGGGLRGVPGAGGS